MQKKTIWIIVAVVTVAFVSMWGYNMLHANDIEMEYQYDFYYIASYKDVDGNTHYPSSGMTFIRADIYESNVSNNTILGLPNCYTLVADDGTKYEWTTGNTDCEHIPKGGSANIIVIYEVPKTVQKYYIDWNLVSVNAKCINH